MNNASLFLSAYLSLSLSLSLLRKLRKRKMKKKKKQNTKHVFIVLIIAKSVFDSNFMFSENCAHNFLNLL